MESWAKLKLVIGWAKAKYKEQGSKELRNDAWLDVGLLQQNLEQALEYAESIGEEVGKYTIHLVLTFTREMHLLASECRYLKIFITQKGGMLVKMSRWGQTPWTCLKQVAHINEGQWRTILSKGAFMEVNWEWFENRWRIDGWGEEENGETMRTWSFTVAHPKPRNTAETIVREVLTLPWDRSFVTKKASQHTRLVIDAYKWLTKEDLRVGKVRTHIY